jgi:RNA polymerase sigma-70 factor (ECF subfamily)
VLEAPAVQVPTGSNPDPELVRRAQSGEREAFDALYRRNAERIYAVCLRMTGDVASAERLTQDAFVRAWQKLGSFRGESAFSSWLHRLAVNVVLEEGRRNRRRWSRVEIMADPGALESAPPARDADVGMDLERAIASLPPGARAVLVLHDIEGYKHEEIARLTGTAIGTTKAQLHRARRLLRERLER